jgi:hypothetical protein
MHKHITLFLVLTALSALSCHNQPTTSAGMLALVDPQVLSVSPDGKQAKVNLGEMDRVQPAEILYVVRNNRLVGILSVSKPSPYTSDCRIMTTKNTTKRPPGALMNLGTICVGDRVVKHWPVITPPELTHDRVVDKIPITIPADNATSPGKVILIPRNQYDQWMKDHPPKPMLPTKGPSN